MGFIIKICGLRDAAAMRAALDAGADMVGLVCFPKSPRHVELDVAADLAAQARGRAEIVVLSVDADDGLVERIVKTVRPDWLQVHGRETPARVATLQALFGVRVMKALGIAAPTDLEAVAAFAAADRLLFDAKPPTGADRPGGNGVAFDWDMLGRGRQQRLDRLPPFMLSGGLGIGNIGDAILATRPLGVDVSSGVERTPGEKDPDLIAAFVAAARAGHARASSSAPPWAATDEETAT